MNEIDLSGFDQAVQQTNTPDLSSFDEAVGQHTNEKKSLSLSDIPKIAAAPIVATSQMFNPIAAALKATYQSYKQGTPFDQAYTENMGRIREAQNMILKSSPTAEAFGDVGSFGAAIAMPGTKLVGSTLGSLEAARGSKTPQEAISKGLTGAAAGYGLGAIGSKVAKTIPTTERIQNVVAQKRAVESFNASSKNLENYLKAMPGETLSEKMVGFGDYLFKKAVVGSGKAIDQVEKQAQDIGQRISNSINSIKSVALKENPEVNSLDIYKKIKEEVIDLQPDEKVNLVTERLFKDLSVDATKESVGKKSLIELSKLKDRLETKIGPLYNKPYDKLNPVEKDLVDSFDILKEAVNDNIEKVIEEKLPEKAGEFANLRTEGHMVFQLKRFAQDRAAEMSAKRLDKGFASGGLIQTGINKAADILSPAPETLKGKVLPSAIGATRSLFTTGQKVPYAIGSGDKK